MADISTTYLGLKLESPLIAASSGITGTVERMKRAQEQGIGAVVVKSMFENSISRESPTPRFKIINRNLKSQRSFVFYSYEQASEFDIDRYAEEIYRAKKELSIPVIPSINCITDDGWKEYAKKMEEAGADALELNVSCPHGSIIFTGKDNVADEMVRITRMVRQTVQIPITVKMSAQLTAPLIVAKGLQDAGTDGVVMFNRLVGLDIDIDEEKPILHGGYAGHGGPWAIHYPLRWISEASPVLNIDICGTSGVANYADVVKYILAGAKAVEFCTAIFLEGYVIIKEFNKGLGEWMDKKGYKSIEDFRGKVSGKAILGTNEIDRRHGKVALIDEQKCIACGKCEKVCLYDSVVPSGGKFKIKDTCDGCGMCVQVCPVKAIEMVKYSNDFT
ncbi:MAG: hypothetical protein PWR06_949 [Thermoanaerobacteraceae bacterium]|jgi:dihydroorotate dehydrogenase (fumarate)|nr:hypothetical protein [Thermoanaerobacteraceae bacterium]